MQHLKLYSVLWALATFESPSEIKRGIISKRKHNTCDQMPFRYINGDSLRRMRHRGTEAHTTNAHAMLCGASQCHSNSEIIITFILIYSAVRSWRCVERNIFAKRLVVDDVNPIFSLECTEK